MKHFFTTFRNLELKEFDNEYLELIPGIRISNRDKIKEKILTEKIRKAIGIIETGYILNSETFVYYEYKDNDDFIKQFSNLEALNIILIWIDDILKNSWIFKDNCIVCETAYLIDTETDFSEASSSRLQYMNTLASGGIKSTPFTYHELESFAELHDKLELYLYQKNSGSLNFMLDKNFSRIGRALMFVKQARESRNIAFKISNYCSAFETLFTTDNAELSHKLAERSAFFIESERQKFDTYKKIKKAYGIRSKLTHGASIKQNEKDSLTKISLEIDSILRLIFNKIIEDDKKTILFDSNNDKIDDYFEALIFK